MPEYIEGSDPQNGLPQNGAPNEDQINPQQDQTPDPAQLQSQLQALQAERDRLAAERDTFEKRFTDTQSEYTKARQALKSLAGADLTQPANPIDDLANRIMQSGKLVEKPEQARALAEVLQSAIAPLQQQNQYLHAAMQNSNQVDAVLKNAFQLDPEMFQDQETYEHVQNAVRQEAMTAAQQGMPLDLQAFTQYALAMGAQKQYFKTLQSRSQQQQPLQRQQMPNFHSMSGVGSGMSYRPAQSQQKTLTPEQQAFENEMKARIPKKA